MHLLTLLAVGLLAASANLSAHAAPTFPYPDIFSASPKHHWSVHKDGGASRPSSTTSRQHQRDQVLRLTPHSRVLASPLSQLVSDLAGVDVWSADPDSGAIVVRTARDDLPEVVSRYLGSGGVQATVLVKDVEQEILAPERASRASRVQLLANKSIKQLVKEPQVWFSEYHPFDDVIAWYKELAAQHPERVLKYLPKIGTTHEGRNQVALHITNVNSTTPLDQKKQVYIQGGIHAREWISHATTQYITYNLLTSTDERITSILDETEIIVVPVVNPDGYVYTWEHDRLWRKNRRDNGNGAFGVDLNRNYDANWGHGGSSSFPYSDTYKGPSVASEPEVQALQAFFNSHPRTVAGLDLHSYSQLILRPIGWDRKDSPHEKQHKQVGDEIAKIIKKVHGKRYVSEKSIDLYATTGAASDYFYIQKFPVQGSAVASKAPEGTKYVRPYGFTIELRPSPEWWGPGFVLDKKEIIPTGEEILPAVLHYIENAVKHPLFE
ncbi:hypothetical protein BCR44DRAFT_122347 [Catenaria anguillulae PL171]|uniref:Peptidase M14 domain-containing protein n=1 Tax=Catenaria anguillulae PL171 TaxID=765915 RepID=A0A1Y2HFU4_9FUNG|nr:hypothetical protein BCR44DRAFT_122347 [Catenaria anguillulae PL171]